jgi:hypothetical protein
MIDKILNRKLPDGYVDSEEPSESLIDDGYTEEDDTVVAVVPTPKQKKSKSSVVTPISVSNSLDAASGSLF